MFPPRGTSPPLWPDPLLSARYQFATSTPTIAMPSAEKTALHITSVMPQPHSGYIFDPGGSHSAVCRRLHFVSCCCFVVFDFSSPISDSLFPVAIKCVALPPSTFQSPSVRHSTSPVTVSFPAMAPSTGASSCWPWYLGVLFWRWRRQQEYPLAGHGYLGV